MRLALAFAILLCGCTTNTTDDVPPLGVYLGAGTFTGSYTLNGAPISFTQTPSLVAIVGSDGRYMLLSEIGRAKV